MSMLPACVRVDSEFHRGCRLRHLQHLAIICVFNVYDVLLLRLKVQDGHLGMRSVLKGGRLRCQLPFDQHGHEVN